MTSMRNVSRMATLRGSRACVTVGLASSSPMLEGSLARYDRSVMSAAAPLSAPARRRLGRYELITPLGRGGMATVYLARMHGTAGFNRLVAVKVLRSELLDDPQLVTMFLDEARLAARIRHPNVVEVYDVETIEGELVIIMRWIEGASLSALQRSLPDGEPMLVTLATRLVHDALLGLHAAHELETETGAPGGLVHRDVSPPNILVAVDGTVLLTDFGIATAADRLHSTGAHVIRGKLAYMAPEQLDGAKLDRRTDVFAAGIVLWELLAGRRLFAASSEEDLLRQVHEMPIEPPGALRSGVPVALDEVCLVALERDPARRYPTAAAFATAIEEACRGSMMEVREVGKIVSERLADSIERRRAELRRLPDQAGAVDASAQPPPAAVAEEATAAMPTLVAVASPAPVKSRGAVLAAAGALGTMLVVAIAMVLGRKSAPIPQTADAGAPATATDVAPAASTTAATAPAGSAGSISESPVGAPSLRSPRPHLPGAHRPALHGGTVVASPPPPSSSRPSGAFVPTEP
jgi:serine/threonine-protein kinase